MHYSVAVALSLSLLHTSALAKPPSRDESDRQRKVLEELEESVDVAETRADKFAAVNQVLSNESNIDLRRRVVDIAIGIDGPERQAFLIDRLTSEQDAGLRSQAATALGQTGSSESLADLAKAAASDRTTSMLVGDIRLTSSARRAAIFALSDLSERFPELKEKAAAELRRLPDTPDLKDNASLADARRQALYQVTSDKTLLQPFFDQLKSVDPKVREQGIVAFRFLKLKKAPPEVVHSLQDSSVEVRSRAALVLGESATEIPWRLYSNSPRTPGRNGVYDATLSGHWAGCVQKMQLIS